ncbi:MAG: SDR family NAD(P)-dependent oxidoreductase [Gaiellaceae bacterium]
MAGRQAIVTGGGKGIGRAVAERLAGDGDRVTIVGRDVGALQEAATEIDGQVSCERCDVADEAAVSQLFESVDAPDILVNNAGVSSSAPLARTELSDWTRQLEVNATGSFLCTRAALPGMRDRDFGRVVFVASTAGRAGFPYTAAYSASKHAALGLMRATAAELAATGVTSNAVCPTYVRSEMTERSIERIAASTDRSAADAEQVLAGSAPLGRLLEPAEVAAAVAFLAADESGAINGQALVLDGGGIQA